MTLVFLSIYEGCCTKSKNQQKLKKDCKQISMHATLKQKKIIKDQVHTLFICFKNVSFISNIVNGILNSLCHDAVKYDCQNIAA